jgi:ATP-dependent Zn protease
VWFIGIAAVLALVIGVVVEETGRRAPMPYGAFLDQLDAGNIASLTFQGTEIDGHFKHPLDAAPSGGTTPRDMFRSRVPDFGDPTLMPTLRSQHVAIDVKSPSQWISLIGRVPWPILFIIGAMIIAGLVRLTRGGKAEASPVMSMHPMGGMIGLLSSLFGKQPQAPSPPPQDSDQPKGRQGII